MYSHQHTNHYITYVLYRNCRADNYESGLDCQWIDITDLQPGHYKLRAAVNIHRSLAEVSYDNNIMEIMVDVPPIQSGEPLMSIVDLTGYTLQTSTH